MSLTVTTNSRDPTVSLVSRITAKPRVSRHDTVNEMRPRGRQVGQVGQCEVGVSSAVAWQAARLTTSRSSSHAVRVEGHSGHGRF